MKGWAPGRKIYFAMQLSKPFVSSEIVSEEKRSESEPAGSEGDIAEVSGAFSNHGRRSDLSV